MTFESIQAAAPDPILGLTEAFNAEPRDGKINLGVGIYQDDDGMTPVLPSVKLAEERLLQGEASKSYLPITGTPAFAGAVQSLLFGDGGPDSGARCVTAHTPGGTGALRIAGDFLKHRTSLERLWLTAPTWPNHAPVFAAAGLETSAFAWFDKATNQFDCAAALEGIAKIPAGDAILLHGCCHNPTGCDPTPDQWREIVERVTEGGLLPVIDFAYQGFANGLLEDAAGLREFAAACPEMIVCSSFSKNFGLYRERSGALTIVSGGSDTATRLASQLKTVIRVSYSNPPSHGGGIVAEIFADKALTAQWETELTAMRERINGLRSRLAERMAEIGCARDFSFLQNQRGMFSMLGLSPEQVEALRADHAIYMAGSSRINLAGLTSANLDRFCDALKSVL